jgi:hypothetical protein
MKLRLIKCHSAGEVFGLVANIDPLKQLEEKPASFLARSLCGNERSFDVEHLIVAQIPTDGSAIEIRVFDKNGMRMRTGYAAMFCASRMAMDDSSTSISTVHDAGVRRDVFKSEGFYNYIPSYHMSVPPAVVHSTGALRLIDRDVSFSDCIVNDCGIRVYSPIKNGDGLVQFAGASLRTLLQIPPHVKKAVFFEVVEHTVQFYSFDALGSRQPGSLEDGIAIHTLIGLDQGSSFSQYCFSGGYFGLRNRNVVASSSIEIAVNVSHVYRAVVNFNGRFITGNSFSGDYCLEESQNFFKEFRAQIN